ncbi:methylmalonic aciduria and homocystinuria type D protein [Oscillatoriales cyanobacterium LEGE 11467]|uniref:Methylmalonic aciduria and homocystinuria type D protein n=1 Tax=Zarconia navalis LEGE 11467 TaxID=1828826 RepID=A0A928Z9M0_9CYAN|nr:methylmalonic aciduria and homocystinuria type D protein [Zarconia navalis]MBE9040901.1 methylmalonic aciduria and homocystinuria type D protein [Zarconia navalis LEGE 11467]
MQRSSPSPLSPDRILNVRMSDFFDLSDRSVELWLGSPSPFVARHQAQILPDWQVSIASTLVILQRSSLPLTQKRPEVEAQKDRLRSRFLIFARSIVSQLHDRGFAADAIDPKSGYPTISRPGGVRHDDVAAAIATVGFARLSGNCTALVHPSWGAAVYPGILLTSASWGELASVERVCCRSGSVF